jgi:DNA-binding transcriptional ArsR family regulator
MTQKQNYELQAKVLAALADPTRLKIVKLLSTGEEMSGTDIAEQLEISLALFCHHSKILTDEGIVKKRREGLVRYHSLNRDFVTSCLESIIEMI